MEWLNLLKGLCPKCGATIDYDERAVFECNGWDCDFFISRDKLSELVAKLQEK
jgi:hypothetical protein